MTSHVIIDKQHQLLQQKKGCRIRDLSGKMYVRSREGHDEVDEQDKINHGKDNVNR